MAPDTPEVRAILETKYRNMAADMGIEPGTDAWKKFMSDKFDPRAITPTYIDETIKNVKPVIDGDELKYISDDYIIVTDRNGKVITIKHNN